MKEEHRLWYEKKLEKSFEKAELLLFGENDRIVLMSDCHRGCGTQGDNFLKNRNIYLAALKDYLKKGYIYIELGDGDELWENRSMKCIEEVHNDVFAVLKQFQDRGRLYQLYGNHDCENRKDIKYPHKETMILREPEKEIKLYLVHGHQVSLLNSVFWKCARFLVRYLWKPLEQFGLSDPTSAARNYRVQEKDEKRLCGFAQKYGIILITGHTHRPILGSCKMRYFNTGSCVHPEGMTCLEIADGEIRLIEWKIDTDSEKRLYVRHEILASCRLEILR